MFDEIIEALAPDGIYFPTLGGQAMFFAAPGANFEQIIITSATGYRYEIQREIFDQILERYNELPDNLRTMAGQYVQPNWPECPNNQKSPYVAKLIHLRRTGEL